MAVNKHVIKIVTEGAEKSKKEVTMSLSSTEI